MLRKDYIQRQFEEFGKVLAMLLSLKKGKDWERFEQESENAAQSFTPWLLSDIGHMSVEEFEQKILLTKEPNLEHKKILARLLFEKMEFFAETHQEDKYKDLKRKCTMLYQHLHDNFTSNEFDLDVHYKLEILKKL